MNLDPNWTFDLDDEFTVRGGREPSVTAIGHWVVFSGVSSLAVHIYILLKTYLNLPDADKPGVDGLAKLTAAPTPEDVQTALDELIGIGAIDIDIIPARNGRTRRRWTIHEAPPEDDDQPSAPSDDLGLSQIDPGLHP
ncbi:hypothetical protein Ae263Ps1_6383c [Pseudonocardia sp. Ae263_Ps1]|uniref:hypothetical protein n=1 Tax=Pseudonocardia sp. Ae263_Ps1 TaxID=1885030 RepID=UPI00094ADD7E|nr:hypothetical protein [Pseudonocardia sp. Ae263_Ps1]OLL70168.1 hypothetical protein Ae263Ps1_6383c [Pseudonocardia sp. Ae263_Ps1]